MEKILLVDDEPTIRNLCQRILELGGYSVMSAAGGEEALRLAQKDPASIDLALLDVVMPIMNGKQLAERLRALNPDINVVLMTGYTLGEIREIVGEKNPYRIIWKPFKTESLLRMIENALRPSSTSI